MARTMSRPPSGRSPRIPASLKYFPFYQDLQRTGDWRGRKAAPERYAQMNGDTRPLYPPVMLEELTGKTVLLVGHGAIGKEIERMLEPFRVQMLRVARSARKEPLVHPVADLESLLLQADVVVLILPLTEESRGLIGAKQFALMRQGALLGECCTGIGCADRCFGRRR